MKTQVLFLAILVTLAPGAQAQDPPATQIWWIDEDRLEIETRAQFSGDLASDYRRLIDQRNGNGDGTVTAAEMDAHNRAQDTVHFQNKPECFGEFDLLRLDGRTPVRYAGFEVEVTDGEGAVSSQAPLLRVNIIKFQYGTPPGDRTSAAMNVSSAGWDRLSAGIACYTGGSFETGDEAYDGISLVQPREDTAIIKDTVRPVEKQRFWDGKGLRSDDAIRDGVPGEVTFTLQSGAAPSSGTVKDVGAVVGYTVAGTAGLLGLSALFTEFGRYHFLRLLFLLPGFTRVQKEAVLEHSKREELYNFIKSNQGPSFSDLRRSLELSNGNLIHHLRILEMQGYVTGQRDGFRKRFYVRGPKVVPTTYLTRTQQQLLDVIGAHPGLTQKELSGLVGLPRELVFYHTKQLAMRGRLEIKQDGNRRRYWLSATPAPATSGMPQGAN
ncbi:MAG TPA: winged helix-turn-helix transcriptional regulator [Candidatus Thermoplasmatota archaeon]